MRQSERSLPKQVRELLAVAEAARLRKVDERPEIKRQLDLMRAVVIAETYFKDQQPNKSGPPIPNISDAEVDEYFKRPANQQKLDQFIKDAQARNPQMAGNQIPRSRQTIGKAAV